MGVWNYINQPPWSRSSYQYFDKQYIPIRRRDKLFCIQIRRWDQIHAGLTNRRIMASPAKGIKIIQFISTELKCLEMFSEDEFWKGVTNRSEGKKKAQPTGLHATTQRPVLRCGRRQTCEIDLMQIPCVQDACWVCGGQVCQKLESWESKKKRRSLPPMRNFSKLFGGRFL